MCCQETYPVNTQCCEKHYYRQMTMLCCAGIEGDRHMECCDKSQNPSEALKCRDPSFQTSQADFDNDGKVIFDEYLKYLTM